MCSRRLWRRSRRLRRCGDRFVYVGSGLRPGRGAEHREAAYQNSRHWPVKVRPFGPRPDHRSGTTRTLLHMDTAFHHHLRDRLEFVAFQFVFRDQVIGGLHGLGAVGTHLFVAAVV